MDNEYIFRKTKIIKLTFQSDLLYTFVLHVRHITQNGKDNETGQETGQAINTARQYRVPVAVVVELVVTGEGQQRAETGTQREEDLRGGVYPHLGVV